MEADRCILAEHTHRERKFPYQRSFLLYLGQERRYSPHTLLAYQGDLNQARRFIKQRFDQEMEDADDRMLRSWVVHLSEQGNQPVSINRKIACLKAFFKFLLLRGYSKKNPARRVAMLKVPSRLPTFVKEEEITHLLDNHSFPEGFVGARDKLIMALFYGTGLRLGEIISLRASQINLTRGASLLKVTGKGNKERLVPFPGSLRIEIQAYLRERTAQFGAIEPDSLLIVSEKGAPAYPMMVYRTVRKYLIMITQADKKSPHVLRHTYATHLLNRGASLEAIKALLGHSSLSATQVYTHNTIEKLKNVYQKAHPKA